MRLSAPIFRLKRNAKTLSRETGIPLHEALERVAAEEGYSSWGLLSAKETAAAPSRKLLRFLTPGDLMLLGARPGQGKTALGLELIVEAILDGRSGVFFTLEFTDRDVVRHFQAAGGKIEVLGERFKVDESDDVSADYIIESMDGAPQGTVAVAVVDYLQLLDQKRTNPPLMTQVRALKAFASERHLIIILISQIDRSFDPSKTAIPSLEHVRLPNPLDVSLFDKTCFLHDGELQFEAL